jgi:hypothetical protein
MIRCVVPLGVVLLALGACSSPAAPPSAAPVSASPSVSVSPSAPASPAVALARLESWVDAAGLTPKVAGAAKPVNDQTGTDYAIDVCGKRLSADEPGYVRYWRWAGTHVGYVEHTVAAYPDSPGAVVLADIKGAEHACASYQQSDSFGTGRLTPAGDYAAKLPSGAESEYAYCVLTTTVKPAKAKGQKAYICTASLTRGGIVDTVRVFGSRPTLHSARANLDHAVAVAGAALKHAVPAAYH